MSENSNEEDSFDSTDLEHLVQDYDFWEIPDAELKKLQKNINNKKLSITEVAEQFKISRKTLKWRMEKCGHPISKQKAGRKPKIITEETREIIKDYQKNLNYGVNKLRNKMVYDSEKSTTPKQIPSYNTVRKVYKEEKLHKFKRTYKKVGKTRYSACFSNLIWHVDIHFIHGDKDKPFYALIDDYSRAIIGYKKIKNCRAKTCLKVLIRTIETNGKPFSIWSDNGPETKAEFHQYLENNNIKHIKTKPHAPQQNGKIERFWRTFESLYEKKPIDEIISIYNESPHTSLPIKETEIAGKQYKRNMTPLEMYCCEETRWSPGKQALWKVDDAVKEFTTEMINDIEEDESD